MKMLRLFIITIHAFFVASPALPQERPSPAIGPAELYFISVGIETYTPDTNLPHLYGAENSAKLVADALIEAGARKGILLTSKREENERDFAVTRSDIMKAIVDLKAQIRADGATTPRIIFYAMGHGGGDPNIDASFLVPGNQLVTPTNLSQSGVSGLIHTTLWNLDVISSLVYFRSHWSMDYMDDFFPSSTMPNPNDFGAILRGFQDQQRRQRIIESRRRNDEYLPGGNPPVPYVVLFDNCFGSIKLDLVADAGSFSTLLRNLIGELNDEGLALYAAKPGTNESSINVPDWIEGEGIMGPMAARRIDAIDRSKSGQTLVEFRELLLTGDPVGQNQSWAPYEHASRLQRDTSLIELLPRDASDQGTYELRYGTGR